MKAANCRIEAGPDGVQFEKIKNLGAWWVQFGETVFLYSSKIKWEDVRKNAARDGLIINEYSNEIKKEEMYLVIQKGRLFQNEFPSVTILLDKGRYLLVILSKEETAKIKAKKEPCYIIKRLEENTIVFDMRKQSEARAETIPWIDALVNNVVRTDFEANLSNFSSYLTRHSTTIHYTDAADWANLQLSNFGYDTTIQTISVNGGNSCNIIADKTGEGSGNRELVLVVAHLDSINTAGGVNSAAPGADDNASGSAGLILMAEVLKDFNMVNDLRLILFGGEEQGLDGSRHYVDNLSAAERSRISAVINMDMIGSLNTSDPTVLLEGAIVSQTEINELSEMALAYTNLNVQTSLIPFASDHVSFIDAGLPAVLTIEGADGANNNIHTADDTIDTINYQLALEIIKMNLAFIVSKLERTGGITMDKYEIKEIVLQSIEEYFANTNKIFNLYRLSGRYKYNEGVIRQTTPQVYLEDYPISKFKEPIYVTQDLSINGNVKTLTKFSRISFTLHIDIDGTDQLNVVSGLVRNRIYFTPVDSKHFIGRVTSNLYTTGGRSLTVEDFSFLWPGTNETIDQLQIKLSGGWFIKPTAEVTFINTANNKKFGPYSVEQDSTYFRDVEVEIDKEDHAADVEPYNTHTHPDRPSDLREENLTIEKVFAKAGIKITRSAGTNIINTSVAGNDNRWSYQELHDAMESHWSAFSNTPQWKMWIFLAELATSDSLGGVMFDGNIDEPGGVDRQGTAIFTKCPWFHTATGDYIVDNPPVDEAVLRELFFNFIHETGHAFNLYHSFQKTSGTPWNPPSWMPLANNDEALSWMNYPESATQSATGTPYNDYNATWFYNRFRFRFDDNENLFLRHAPQSYVEMGNSDWGDNHGRVTQESLDMNLQLSITTNKSIMEMGEPVFLDLRLKNIGEKNVMVQPHFDPRDGFVEISVTNPRGKRKPFIPFIHDCSRLINEKLKPGKTVSGRLNLTMGKLGFPFKEPGPYRIEVCYRSLNGKTAAAILQLWLKPSSVYEDMPVISELFNAKVGRVLCAGGSRLMEDVNDKIDWVINHLSKTHPAKFYLSSIRGAALVKPHKVLKAGSNKLTLIEPDFEKADRYLSPLIDNMEQAADSLGDMAYQQVVDWYTKSEVGIHKKTRALKAQEKLLDMLKKHKVSAAVLDSVEEKVKELS